MTSSQEKMKIVIISDGTGETATAIARAVMTQFKEKDVYFTRYKNVRNIEQLDSIFAEAAIHHDLIIYTIVAQNLRTHINELVRINHVRILDLLGPALTSFSNYFEQEPSSEPGLLHAVNDDYFKRVAAMEFTLNHDDGKHLESLHLADVILIGVSRTSKTPLSVYLSLRGIKVTNVPMIYGTPLPKALFEIDQRKIFALTIDPGNLMEIRKKRLDTLGSKFMGDYADESKIMQEIEWANKIFKENKRWPVFDVTGRALEDVAAEIIKLISMRNSNFFKQSQKKETDPKN